MAGYNAPSGAADGITVFEVGGTLSAPERDTYIFRDAAFGGAAGATSYGTADTFLPIYGFAGNATEANVSFDSPRAGTVISVLVEITANTLTATSCVLTLRAAGVVIASLNILTAGTGIKALTITGVIAAGDKLALAVDVTTHTGGSFNMTAIATTIRWTT